MITLMILGGVAIYIAIVVLVTRAVARAARTVTAKWIAGTICAVVFLLIPTWDEFIGRYYFKRLCEAEGGMRVYKHVELGLEYWYPDGTPKFIKANGEVDKTVLKERLEFKRDYQDESGNVFHLRKTTEGIVDKQNGQLLGAYTYFIHFGGWLVNSTGFHVTGRDCPSIESASLSRLIQAVIKPKVSIK